MIRRPGFVLLLLGLGIVALVAAGLTAQAPGDWGSLRWNETVRYIGCVMAAGGLYAAAVWLVQARPMPRGTVAGVLAVGLAARLLVLVAPPVLSTDLYRYVWDGRVQAAGINPYLYVPADPALTALRDTVPGPTAIYPNINRADTAPTIYPPAAQALFAAIHAVAPSIWGVKAAMLGFDLVAAGMLLLLLRAARLPAAQVLIWAWNPLVIWEFANEGHVDAPALAFSVLAMLAAVRLRPALAGAALGVAVLMKLLPAALFPALWRRWDWRTPGAAAVVVLGGYALYASAGWRVLGYLPGYAAEEELDGGGFLLLRVLGQLGRLPHRAGAAYAVAGLAVLGGLAAWIALRGPFPGGAAERTARVGRDALILSGGVIAVLSPHYPWYLTMLALPAVLAPAWTAVWLTVAAPLLYLDHGHDEVMWPVIVFLPAVPLLVYDLYSYRALPRAGQLAEGSR